MGIALAVVAALTYGIADWCGGKATRRLDALVVTGFGQAASLVLVTVAVAVLSDPVAGLGWGAAGGLAGIFGLVCFYSALAGGVMTVVAPVTAVVSLTVPVIVGVALGDRPSAAAWAGILLAVVAVGLVGGILGAHTPVRRRDLVLAALGGTGFGLIFVAFAQAPDDSGLWPLFGARVTSVAVAATLVLATGRLRTARGAGARLALGIALLAGLLDMTANVSYLVASRHEILPVVAAVTSMYPVSTIVLAMGLDHERVSRSQVGGMAIAGAALALISAG